MASAYYYSSTAGSYTVTTALTSTATSIPLNSVTGLPGALPYKVVLEPGTASEEIVKVTGIAGLSLTVTRGWDGTSAVAHASGAAARHMLTAEDLTLSRTHEAATAAHGTVGNVVGTSDTQALTNKDLSGAGNVFPASLATLTGTQALTNKDLTGAGNTFPTTLLTTTGTQTVTNKDLSSSTNNFGRVLVTALIAAGTDLNTVTGSGSYVQPANVNATLALHYPITSAGLLTVDTYSTVTFQRYQVLSAQVGSNDVYTRGLYSGTWSAWQKLADDADLTAHTGATAAHGATGAVVGTTNSQTLTNKNLTSGTNTFPATLVTDTDLTWNSYAPNFGNLPLTSSWGRYRQFGNEVEFEAFGLVSGNAVGAVSVTIPVAIGASTYAGGAQINFFGTGIYHFVSGSHCPLWLEAASATPTSFTIWTPTAGSIYLSQLAAGTPSTGASGDTIHVHGWYRTA